MRAIRTGILAVAILVSLAISWFVSYWLGGVAVLAFLPFLPFLFRRGSASARQPRRCVRCGYTANADDEFFCPRDGSTLGR